MGIKSTDRRIAMPDRAGHDSHPRPRFKRIHIARPNRQNRRLARQADLMQPDIDRATNRRSRPLHHQSGRITDSSAMLPSGFGISRSIVQQSCRIRTVPSVFQNFKLRINSV